MNPARTLGPDVATGAYPALWAYVVGPLAGALLAATVPALAGRELTVLTAKLFHDSAYPSVHATALPSKPHRNTNQTAGRGEAAADPAAAYPDETPAAPRRAHQQ